MAVPRLFRSLCTHGACWCRRCVCLLLIGAAAVQTAVIVAVVVQFSIPVPTALVQRISNQLGGDLVIRHGRIHLDLLGGVLLEDVAIAPGGGGDPWFRCDAVWLDLDLDGLLLQRRALPIDGLRLTGGRLYAPPMLSATGTSQLLADGIELSGRLRRATLAVDHASLQFGDIRVHAAGVCLRPNLGLEPAVGDAPLATRAGQAIHWLMNRMPLAQTLGGATISLQLAPDAGAGRATEANVAIARSVVPRIDGMLWLPTAGFAPLGITVEELRVRLADVRPATMALGELAFEIGSLIVTPADWRAQRLTGTVGSWRWCPDAGLGDMHLVAKASTLTTPWSTGWHNVLAVNMREGGAAIDGLWRTDTDYGRAAGTYRWSPNGVAVSFAGQIDPTHEAIAPHIPYALSPLIPQLEGTVQVNGQFLLAADASWTLRFDQLAAHAIRAGEQQIAIVRTRGEASADAIKFPTIDVWLAEDQTAHGAYFHDLAPARRHEFGIYAEGSVLPAALDPFLHFQWWDVVRHGLTTDGGPITASVAVTGQWGAVGRTTVSVGAAGRTVAWQGLAVETMSVGVRYDPGWAEVYGLQAFSDDRWLTGTLRWDLPLRTGTDDHLFTASFEGTLELDEIRPLLGPRHTWPALLCGDSPPFTRVWLSFPNSQVHDPQRALVIDADWPGTIRVRGMPLADIRAQAVVAGESLRVSIDSLAMSGGTGNLQFEFPDLDDPLLPWRGQFEAHDVRYAEFRRHLQQSLLPTDEPAAESPDIAGLFRVEGQLAGDLTGIPGMSGSGTAAIYQADLGKVQVLGALSRLLDALGMGFSSLPVTDVVGDWNLGDGLLRLDPIRARGPSVTIDARGTIGLLAGNLDFLVSAAVVRNLFGILVRPITSVLEFQLSGTLSEPEWNLRLRRTVDE
jgi:hypothetical protein